MAYQSIIGDIPLCRRLCGQITQAVPSCRYAGHTIHLQSLHPASTPRGSRVPPHQHMHYEGIVVLEGHAWDTTAERRPLAPGTLLLHAPRNLHSWEAPDAAVIRLGLWFTITPSLPVPRLAQWPCCSEVRVAVEALLQEARDAAPGWRDRAAARLVLLLARLLEMAEWADSTPEPPVQVHGPIAALVEQFLRDNLAQVLTLADIADQIGMSVPTLTRHFRQETGDSVMGRLHALRMQEAAGLLAHTPATAVAIGQQVGLSEPSYFCRRFRQHFGVSPQHYRQQYQIDR